MAFKSRATSMLDSFTLSPLPHPVLLLIIVVLLLSITSSFRISGLIFRPEDQLNPVLLLTPVALLLLIRFLQSSDSLLAFAHNVKGVVANLLGFLSPYDRPCLRNFYNNIWPQDGSGIASLWGVATIVMVLIALASFRSAFL